MYDPQLKTPSEILFNHKNINKIWTAAQLGTLLYLKLVRGKKLRRGCLLNENDVVKIFNENFGSDTGGGTLTGKP